MSFSALAGGAECGPVNPLAQLSKTFAHDRGAQQVSLSCIPHSVTLWSLARGENIADR